MNRIGNTYGSSSVYIVLLMVLGLMRPAVAAVDFEPYFTLNTDFATDTRDDYEPSIANDGKGHFVAVWRARNGSNDDIFVSRSSNDGATWTAPTTMNTDTAGDQAPVIATDGKGKWVCVWHRYDAPGSTYENDGDIFASTSSDNGAAWSTPVPVNSDAASDTRNDTNVRIATDKDGHWVATWIGDYDTDDDSGGPLGTDPDIYTARSSNNGITWSTVAPLNSNAASDSRQDSYPSIATDGNGVWITVWEVEITFAVESDIYYARSVDNGASWSAAVPLNADAATDAFRDGVPDIAADGNGNWVAVWLGANPDGDISVARSPDGGVTWSVRGMVNNDADEDTAADNVPRIFTDGNGTWVASWTSISGDFGSDSDIMTATSTDNGVTWSDYTPLNNQAPTDIGDDRDHSITTDGNGLWLAIWRSSNSPTGMSFTDANIFAAFAESTGGGLQVVAPNGGEKWTIGSKKKIKWNSNAGGNVKLELLENGSVVDVIKNTTPNDGKQNWKIPNSLQPGKNYKLRITDKSNPTDSDISDGKFRLKSGH